MQYAEIIKCLVDRAKKGCPITYGELAETVGGVPNGMSAPLDKVNKRTEKPDIGCLLSVIVVRKDTRLPGLNFFVKWKSGEDGNITFFQKERDRVFQIAKSGRLDSLRSSPE
ncbi:MAG: hypothetical protein ACR2QC_03630 [Gammaproteobacteria bacterium]